MNHSRERLRFTVTKLKSHREVEYALVYAIPAHTPPAGAAAPRPPLETCTVYTYRRHRARYTHPSRLQLDTSSRVKIQKKTIFAKSVYKIATRDRRETTCMLPIAQLSIIYHLFLLLLAGRLALLAATLGLLLGRGRAYDLELVRRDG